MRSLEEFHMLVYFCSDMMSLRPDRLHATFYAFVSIKPIQLICN